MRERSRKILVIGENGQVAQALRVCIARGHVVRLAGRSLADVSDRSAVERVVAAFKPELIVNAAAYIAVDKAEDASVRAFQVNRDGAAHVADVAAQNKLPIIHLSTDYVYDGSKLCSYIESDPPNPLGVYGASKLAGEEAVAEIASDYVILRTSWVFSPFGVNFLKTMLRLAANGKEIDVVDDQWGAPTFATDLAEAIVSIGESLWSSLSRSKLAGLYHATGAGETTWCRFSRAIMEQKRADHRVRCALLKHRPTQLAPSAQRSQRGVNHKLSQNSCGLAHAAVSPPQHCRVFVTMKLPGWR